MSVEALIRIPKFNRRTAFKAGLAALGATVVGREAKTFIEGTIDTPSGVFYPLYEYHDTGVREQDVPDGLDAFFRELTMTELEWRANPEDLLGTQYFSTRFREETIRSIIDFPILRKLAQDSTLVVFGDTAIPEDFADKAFNIAFTRMVTGGAVTAAGTGYLLSDWVIHKLEQDDFTQEELNRRKFIGLSTVGATLALEAPLISMLLSTLEISTQNQTEKGNIAQRILQRVIALADYFSPEDHDIYFRSLVMANKLLTISEAVQRQTGRKARVGFNVGTGHSSIEDFLQAGHNFTRFLISRYPDDFLQAVTRLNGGTENFCSARGISLVPDLTPKDLEEPDILYGRPVKHEQTFRDLPLMEALKSKLAA